MVWSYNPQLSTNITSRWFDNTRGLSIEPSLPRSMAMTIWVLDTENADAPEMNGLYKWTPPHVNGDSPRTTANSEHFFVFNQYTLCALSAFGSPHPCRSERALSTTVNASFTVSPTLLWLGLLVLPSTGPSPCWRCGVRLSLSHGGLSTRSTSPYAVCGCGSHCLSAWLRRTFLPFHQPFGSLSRALEKRFLLHNRGARWRPGPRIHPHCLSFTVRERRSSQTYSSVQIETDLDGDEHADLFGNSRATMSPQAHRDLACAATLKTSTLWQAVTSRSRRASAVLLLVPVSKSARGSDP